jgi:hypothetical protein
MIENLNPKSVVEESQKAGNSIVGIHNFPLPVSSFLFLVWQVNAAVLAKMVLS